MRITKDRKETVIRFDEKNPTAEVTTANAALKRRLGMYARSYPESCRQVDDDGFGTLAFVVDKRRIGIRLTAPYSDERKQSMRTYTKENHPIDHVRRNCLD